MSVQPGDATDLSPVGESGSIPEHRGPRPSTSNNNLSAVSSPRRTGGNFGQTLRKIFGGTSRDKEYSKKIQSIVTNDGSIRQATWDGLSPNSPSEKRVETLHQLHEADVHSPSVVLPITLEIPSREPPSFLSRLLSDFFHFGSVVVRNRSLQVSTLEGLYHDTKDMLKDPDTKDPVLRLIIELTDTQRSQLGLALRHTFFEQIQSMGCEELTLKWLSSLSDIGRNVSGFEKDMDNLISEWVQTTLSEHDHPQALNVLQLCDQYIRHNAAFVSPDSVKKVVNSVCKRACNLMEPLTLHCLTVLESILKYSEIPCELLMSIVSVICLQVCDKHFRNQSWQLARGLLQSQLGHRTRKHLQLLLEQGESLQKEIKSPRVVRILRGAIFCLANANWGICQIDAGRCSPANIIASMEVACKFEASICADVLLALRRLIVKHGRELQQTTWARLIHLFETVIQLCNKDNEYRTTCKSVHDLLQTTEKLYKDGYFAANADILFDLIERCADERPDSSVISLIEYRASNISPLQPDWIPQMLNLVKVYSKESQSFERRTKVYSVMHTMYNRYRMLYEHELITQLMLPVLMETDKEKDPKIQYQLINVLLDVAKTVSLREESVLFESTVDLIRQLFNEGIASVAPVDDEMDFMDNDREYDAVLTKTVTLDNLMVLANVIDEILCDRWTQLKYKNLTLLIDMLIGHILIQYNVGWMEQQGEEVRGAVIKSLLLIHCCPITNRLQRPNRDDSEPHTNVFIRRKSDYNEKGFSWSKICGIVTTVLNKDKSLNVLQTTLENLGRVLEHIELVKTATVPEVDNLIRALVDLYKRDDLRSCSDNILAKYLPPVLATLMNYTTTQVNRNNEMCRVIVDCVKYEHVEALMACDIAIQLQPEAMGSLAILLIDNISKLPSNAKRAIPLIELMSDSAEIDEFHKFFQERHFRTIIDILTPYANINQFNTYIVACIHRIMMRWYVQVPNDMKPMIQKYVDDKLTPLPMMFMSEGMHRQHSGDGRQVPGNLFLLGGDPSTPPPMDGMASFREEKKPEIIFDEIQRALKLFFRIGQITPDMGEPIPPKKLHEVAQEHYFVNDCIISIKTLSDRQPEDPEADVFSSNGDGPCSPPVGSLDGFTETRKRHQSAFQEGRRHERNNDMDAAVKFRPKALDDLYATGGPHLRKRDVDVKAPAVTFTQFTVRHMYGKSSWLMRSFDFWPDDFMQMTELSSSASFFLFLIVCRNAMIRLGKKGNDEHLHRALRNIDRLPGIELHAVGVLYIGPDQDTESQILSNTFGSERYSRFIKRLGGPINLDKCPAGLEPEIHGKFTYEFSDELSRIVYLIATFMPNNPNDPQFTSKKKLIANNFVSIVFNESGRPYRLGSVCGQFGHVALEIVPADSKSVLITVHAKQEIACWMAMKRVLLCDAGAARLIRKLIVRAQLSVNVYRSVIEQPNSPYISLAVDRLRQIISIKNKHRISLA